MSVLVGLLAAFLLPITLGTLLAHLLFHFAPALRTDRFAALPGYAIANWVTVVLFLLFALPEMGLGLAELGFKSTISLDEVGLALFLALVSLMWFAVVSKLNLLKDRTLSLRVENRQQVVLLLFYAPITAAFCEEFLYRGFAITALNSALGNVWTAGIVSSILFALLHIPRHGLGGFVNAGTIGLLLMLVFILTGSLYPGILIHSIVDLVGFVIIPLVRSRR